MSWRGFGPIGRHRDPRPLSAIDHRPPHHHHFASPLLDISSESRRTGGLTLPERTERLDTLGGGQTGSVDLAALRVPGWIENDPRVRRKIIVAAKRFDNPASAWKAEREFEASRTGADFAVLSLETRNEDGIPVLQMDYLNGARTLRQSMAQGHPVNFRLASELLVYLLLTLQRWWEAGLAHNDLSLDNVLMLDPSHHGGVGGAADQIYFHDDRPNDPTFVVIDFAEACGYFWHDDTNDSRCSALAAVPNGRVFLGDTFTYSQMMIECSPYNQYERQRIFDHLADERFSHQSPLIEDLFNFLLLIREDVSQAASIVYQWYLNERPPSIAMRQQEPQLIVQRVRSHSNPSSSSSSSEDDVNEDESPLILQPSILFPGLKVVTRARRTRSRSAASPTLASRELMGVVLQRMLTDRCYFSHHALDDLKQDAYFRQLIERTVRLIDNRLAAREEKMTLFDSKPSEEGRLLDPRQATKPARDATRTWQIFLGNFFPGTSSFDEVGFV